MNFALRLRSGPKPRRLFYGWYITIAGACSNFLLIGIAVLGFGVFIEQFRQEFGWSVKAIALGFSLRSLETGLLSPLTGMLVDRFGPRRMALTGVIIVAAGLFMFSQARNLPVYYAASAILALGQSLGGFGAFTLAIMNWFNRKRGRAMGLINSGNGFGYFATLIMASLIQAFGWRDTLIILSATVLVAGIPLALVIRDRPEPFGYLPDGEEPAAKESEPTELGEGKKLPSSAVSGSGFDVAQVIRMPAFYLLCMAGALGGATQGAWVTFQIPHYQSAGFSMGLTGVLVAVYGLVQVPMRFGAGWLGDIIGRRRIYITSYLLHGIGLLLFAFISPSRLWLLAPYYLIFGLGHAGWVVGGQTIVADYFGTRRFATIRGLRQSLQVPASILMPLLMGALFDRYGNYRMAFSVLAIICCTAVFWLLLIRRRMWIEEPAPPLEPRQSES